MGPGDLLEDRFELRQIAGAGGMGEVYRALDRESGAMVAVKVLIEGRGHHRGRFEREARALAELSHPGIVRYVAHGLSPAGVPFLAMEWLDGEDLAARLARGRLGLAASLQLAAQLAEALGAAHARGIVHRDLKPSNVFLVEGDPGRARLLDFGVARQEGARSTRSGRIVGTPAYMAPEQAGGSALVDARVDVFSLGCVLYECLTGRPAFGGEQVMAILAKILIEHPPRAGDLCPELPPALDALLARMLAKDRAKRPLDGAAVARALGDGAWTLAPPSRGAPAATLGRGERRAIAVVLIAAEGRATAPDARTLDEDEGAIGEEELRRTAEAWGGRCDLLCDGSALMVFTGAGPAMDLAAQAARAALALAGRVGDRAMALATARAEIGERRPASEVLDRAASMLRRPRSARAGAPPWSIALDEESAGLLDARFEITASEGGRLLRGERDLEVGARTLLGKPTRCLGREPELGALLAGLDACIEEPGARAVLITAGPGVGKSRLRQELIARVQARGAGVEVWMARGDPMRAGAPFGLLAQIIRAAARFSGGEPLERRREKLEACVARQVEEGERRRVADFLGEIAGTRFPDAESVQLRAARHDAKLRGDQMRRAWVDFLQAECRAHPVLLVLEDLHWGDAPTIEHIDAAISRLHDAPLFVLSLARPEVRERFPASWGARELSEMRLGRLSRKACERLVREALGGALPADALAALVERSDGNAFFLEELVRAAAGGREETPGSVLSVMQSRLDALAPEARRILRAGSVLGEHFCRGAVEGLIGGTEGLLSLDERLAELAANELVTRRAEASFPGEVEYAFRHGLLREAAYDTLTEADRALGHRLSAEWLLRMGEPSAMVIAEHFERGGEPARAAEFYGRAAEQALESNDLGAAIARATRAATPEIQGEALGLLLLVRAEAHFWRGELGEAGQLALKAKELLPTGGDRWHAAVQRAVESAERLGLRERILTLADALDRPASSALPAPSPITALALVMGQCSSIGALPRARALAARLDLLAPRLADDPRVTGAVASGRGTLAFMTGELGAHREQRALALASFERAGNLRAACHERCWLAVALLELGLYEEARALLLAALAEATRIDLRFVIGAAKYSLGTALAHLGALGEARAVAAQAVAEFQAQGDERRTQSSRASYAAILRMAGALDQAEIEARRSLESAGAPLWRPLFLATLAEVLLARGRAPEAMEQARPALEATVTQPHALGEARVRLVHAEALAATGDPRGARAAVAVAAARLLERAATLADPSARVSFLERVPENARTLTLHRASTVSDEAGRAR